jgi:ATP-dependent RNA helicase DHX29
MPPKKKKKKKKKPRNDTRGFVTSSKAKAPVVPKVDAATKKICMKEDGNNISGENAGKLKYTSKDGICEKPEPSLPTFKSQEIIWNTDLPSNYLPYLKSNKTTNKKEIVSFMLGGELEHEIFQYTKNNGCKLAINKERITFKNLNYAYVTLEKLGFAPHLIETVMQNNVGNDLKTMLWWSCLNLEHDGLPLGFVDKRGHALKSSEISGVYAKQGNDVKKRVISNSFGQMEKVEKSSPAPLSVKNITIPIIDATQENDLNKVDKNSSSKINGNNSSNSNSNNNDNANTILNNLSWMYDESSSEDDNIAFSSLQKHKKPWDKSNHNTNINSKPKKMVWSEEKIQAAREKKIKEKEAKKLILEKKVEEEQQKKKEQIEEAKNDTALEEHVDEDGGFGLGDWLDMAETAEIVASDDGDYQYYDDLTISSSWTGKSPYELLLHLTRKSKKKLQFSREETNSIKFGGGYLYTLIIPKNYHKNKKEMKINATKLCRNKTQGMNLISLMALYKLFQNIPLQIQLPDPFRKMWNVWILEDKEKELQEYRNLYRGKIDFVQKLILKSNVDGLAKLPLSCINNSNSSTNRENDTINLLLRFKECNTNKALLTGDATTKLRDIFIQRINSTTYMNNEKKRKQTLPIMDFVEDITSHIEKYKTVIITGETGCGKSTQVPHIVFKAMLLNDNRRFINRLGDIICTQPRRISATTIAKRVSMEMGDQTVGSGFCGYSIRGESKRSKNTTLFYVTTGILLRRLQQDPLLSSVSCVIVDEVHERTVQSDFLLIALKNILLKRPDDFHVILMSATMNSQKVSRYFNGAPIIAVPGRTFPVSVSHLEDVIELTQYIVAEDSNYAGARHKITHGNNQNGVRIKMARNMKRGNLEYNHEELLEEMQYADLDPEKYSKETCLSVARLDTTKVNYELIETLLLHLDDKKHGSAYSEIEGAILIFLPGMGEITRLQEILSGNRTFSNRKRYRIVPLYSSLSIGQQQDAFSTPPSGIRKIVLATNIAETGVTIPDVVFVIDTCLVKETRFNEHTRIRGLVQCYIPQSSGKQRRGRAGRVREGFCFRLVTKSRYETFAPELTPELLRVPLDELCLNIIVNDNSPMAYLRGALDAPKEKAIQSSLNTLEEVGAIKLVSSMNGTHDMTKTYNIDNNELTPILLPLGYHLSNIPSDVRIGKMIILSSFLSCVDPVTTIAACLAYKSPFIEDDSKHKFIKNKNIPSDHLIIIEAVKIFQTLELRKRGRWCRTNGLSYSTLHTILQLKKEFKGHLRAAGFSCQNDNSRNAEVVLAVIAGGMWPNIAFAKRVGIDKFEINTKSRAAAVHPTSICHQSVLPLGTKTAYFAYHLMVKTRRYYLRDMSMISPQSILLFCGKVEDADIEYGKREIVIDGWIRIHVASKCAILILNLRQEISEFLMKKYLNPENNGDFDSKKLTKLIIDVLNESSRLS